MSTLITRGVDALAVYWIFVLPSTRTARDVNSWTWCTSAIRWGSVIRGRVMRDRGGGRGARRSRAVWRLVWLTTSAAQAVRPVRGSRTGTETATRTGSINWSSRKQPGRPLPPAAPPSQSCVLGGSRVTRTRYVLPSSSADTTATRIPARRSTKLSPGTNVASDSSAWTFGLRVQPPLSRRES